MRIFISSRSVDTDPAILLIDGLRRSGVDVEHSPRNPHDGEDPRWSSWYANGLAEAIRRCDSFVAVVDDAWDSSTWMACEAEEAMKSGKPFLFWNPGEIRVVAAGMVRYLREGLPPALEDAISGLVRHTTQNTP